MLFKLENIKVLHIEPTTVCNASCPQCVRENTNLYNKSNQCELLLDDIKRLVDVSIIKNLDKMFMCGNFGDPVASKDCLKIFQYFKEVNPNITLGLNTNGSIKNPAWWKRLATVFTGMFDYVVFSVDGLEDTNHIYRKNVSWNRVIKNAQAFIDAGGHAHWDMLVFQHNQHQVDQAQELARIMGFLWFRAKVSKRFNLIPVGFLSPPNGYNLPNVQNPDYINCHALQEQSLFLAANGEYLPCCFMGSRIFNRDSRVDQVLQTENFQGVIDSWETSPLPICIETCGTSTKESSSSFENQFVRNVQLR